MLLRPPDGSKKVTVGEVSFKATACGYFEIPNEDRFCAPLLSLGWSVETPSPVIDTTRITKQSTRQMETYATVVRCTCGEPASHVGVPCPVGRVEQLGMIQFYHRNPLRRWLWWLSQRLKFIKGNSKWLTS